MRQATKTVIQGYLTRNPDNTNARIAGNVTKPDYQVRAGDVAKIREEMGLPNRNNRKSGPKPNGSSPRSSRRRGASAIKGKTIGEFREKHDVAFKIEQAIEEHLPEDGTEYFEDADFREMVGVPVGHWRRFADDPHFEPYRYKRGPHNLWAPKALKLQIIEILGV